ncbi:hypothetical protein [Streptomyces sp. NBC_00354]|uniref:hypothetical protein n=1 Tax=Streptomyces sp. NBC_00354 TaxID=2975723 RepID=UPI002E2539C4
MALAVPANAQDGPFPFPHGKGKGSGMTQVTADNLTITIVIGGVTRTFSSVFRGCDTNSSRPGLIAFANTGILVRQN